MDNLRESHNIAGWRSAAARGAIGLGTLVLALSALDFGIDSSAMLQPDQAPQPQPKQSALSAPYQGDARACYVATVLGETEDTWDAIFKQQLGRAYTPPALLLYSGSTPGACGTGQSATGVFYCPAEMRVCLDLSFLEALHERFHAPGDFAQGYVIAHEVGHHVQHLLGISDRVEVLMRRDPAQSNALSLRLNLQADCFAGLWTRHANAGRHLLEPGDIEEALAAAGALSDDRPQRQSPGLVMRDTFTHGSSMQRLRWFKRGLQSGDIKQCDTFALPQP